MEYRKPHALVVEGGAMRGIFSAGVLDHLLDINYTSFDFCLGVSAGSTSLVSWLSHQKKTNLSRNHRLFMQTRIHQF